MYWHLPSTIHYSLAVHGSSTSWNSGDVSRYPSMNFLWFDFIKWFRVAQRETFCFWVTSISTWSESRMAFPLSPCDLPSCSLSFKISLTSSPWGHTLHHYQSKGKDPERGKSPVKLLGQEAVGNGCHIAQGYWLEPSFHLQATLVSSTSFLQRFARSPMYPLLLCSLDHNNTLLLHPGFCLMTSHPWQGAVNKWIYFEIFSGC